MDPFCRNHKKYHIPFIKTYHFFLLIENEKLTKIISLTGNDLETSGLLYSAMFCTNQKNAFLICKSSEHLFIIVHLLPILLSKIQSTAPFNPMSFHIIFKPACWRSGLLAGLPVCLLAGRQVSRRAGKQDDRMDSEQAGRRTGWSASRLAGQSVYAHTLYLLHHPFVASLLR